MIAQTQSQDMMHVVQSIETLPANARIAHIIQSMSKQITLRSRILIDYLREDPSLMFRVIQISNHMNGEKPNICTIEQAVARIGFRRLVDQILPQATNCLLDPSNCSGFNMARFTMNNLIYAHLAASAYSQSQYAQVDDDCVKESIYTSAFLQRIGIIVLVQLFPEKMSSIFKSSHDHPGLSINSLLEQHYDINHYVISNVLFQKWNLPDSIKVSNKLQTSTDMTRDMVLIKNCLNWADQFQSSEYVNCSYSLTSKLGISKGSVLAIRNDIIDHFEYYYNIACQYGRT